MAAWADVAESRVITAAVIAQNPTVFLGIVGGKFCRRKRGFFVFGGSLKKPSLWIRHSLITFYARNFTGLRAFFQGKNSVQSASLNNPPRPLRVHPSLRGHAAPGGELLLLFVIPVGADPYALQFLTYYR